MVNELEGDIMPAPSAPNSDWDAALTASTQALPRVAGFVLPTALDRRILDLGERKDELTPTERAELLAWVTLALDRSAEKLEAEVALRRLAAVCPELAVGS